MTGSTDNEPDTGNSSGRAADNRRGRSLAIYIVAVVIIVFGIRYYFGQDEYIGDQLAAGNDVVMYSLTTCPFCKRLRTRFQNMGIPFRELFLDRDEVTDPAILEMFYQPQPGTPPVGTPTLIVNGKLLINNPPMRKILEQLHFKATPDKKGE